LRIIRALIVASGFVVAAPALGQKPFVDVGKQPAITILIGSTPWYPAFEKLVGLYEEQTGNKIKLDVVPFGGILEKARNAVRSGQSPYDLFMLDTQWAIEFYEGGFLSPLKEIDTAFDVPKEVLTYSDSGYRNTQKRWRTADGGKLMAVHGARQRSAALLPQRSPQASAARQAHSERLAFCFHALRIQVP